MGILDDLQQHSARAQKLMIELQVKEQRAKTKAAELDEERARIVLENVKALAEGSKAQIEEHELNRDKARIEKETAEFIQEKVKAMELDPNALRKPPWGSGVS